MQGGCTDRVRRKCGDAVCAGIYGCLLEKRISCKIHMFGV